MPRIPRIWIPSMLLAALALTPGPAAAGGGGGGHCSATNGTGATVALETSCFTPTVLRAEKGGAVTFENVDPYPHTITGVGGWGTGFEEIAGHESMVVRFPRDGVYAYTCVLHPGMSGAVVVGDALGPGASASKGEVQPVAVSEGSVEAAPDPDPTPAERLDATPQAAASTSAGAGLAWPLVAASAGLVGTGLGFAGGRLRRRRASG